MILICFTKHWPVKSIYPLHQPVSGLNRAGTNDVGVGLVLEAWPTNPASCSVFKEKRSLPDVSSPFFNILSFATCSLLPLPFSLFHLNNVAFLLVHSHHHRSFETTSTHSYSLCIRIGKHATYPTFRTATATTYHITITNSWAHCYPSFVTTDDSFEQCIPSRLYTQPC